MTTITLEVPDDLAARLQPLQDRLPELLTHVLDSWPGENALKVTGSAVTYPVFQEIISFLASGPTPEQIIAQKQINWQNRAHFFGITANLMRQTLVNYALSRRAAKRGAAPTG